MSSSTIRSADHALQDHATMTATTLSPPDTARVGITDRAVKRVAEIAAHEAPGTWLRITVEGGGCSGFQYKFELVPASTQEDFTIERGGARVAIDPMSLEYMSGSEIDFVDDLMGAAFKIKNPQATAACGCGTSFSI
jgi:iron-sulfur cluster assembly accessory protein